MAMCAGVQKVSRPMLRCQEISHCPPTTAEVVAMSPAQRYQGMASTRSKTDAAVRDPDCADPKVVAAMDALYASGVDADCWRIFGMYRRWRCVMHSGQ